MALLRSLLLLLQCLCVFVSGKIPVLHWVPCGCGLGKRHSNAFVTQRGGNCKRFLHNSAFVPLPGGYWASQEPNNTPKWFGTGVRKWLNSSSYRWVKILHLRRSESVPMEIKENENSQKFSYGNYSWVLRFTLKLQLTMSTFDLFYMQSFFYLLLIFCLVLSVLIGLLISVLLLTESGWFMIIHWVILCWVSEKHLYFKVL